MRHVIWKEGSSGPGVDAVRSFLREFLHGVLDIGESRFGTLEVSMPATGSFDANLRRWVKHFQTKFNHASEDPLIARLKARLPGGRLAETGEVDCGTRLVMGISEDLARDGTVLLPDGVTAVRLPLTASERAAAKPGDGFVGSAYRIVELDKLLRALGLDRAAAGGDKVSDKRIAWLDGGWLMVPDGHVLYGAAEEGSECAALVQSLGVPSTDRWRRGPRVQDIEFLEPGTVVATLGSGVYLSDYSGMSHVGIFLRKTAHGLAMLDQYREGKGTLGIRVKPFGAPHTRTRVKASRYINPDHSHRMEVTDAHGNKAYARDYSLATVRYRTNLINDGSEYYVLLDDGQVARQSSNQDRRRTLSETVEALGDLVQEYSVGSAENRRALTEALKKVRPAVPPGT